MSKPCSAKGCERESAPRSDLCRAHRYYLRGKWIDADGPSVKVCMTLPGRVHRLLTDAVPWGERSGWLARLITKELDQ